MTLRHLNIFLTVCKEKSITKAGEKLFISQPAVSNAIKELETYYKTPLFDRISKKLYLTESGKTLYQYALHITSLFEELETSMENQDENTLLKIGSSITIGNYYMPLFISNFKELHPNIKTYVTIHNSDIIEKMILENELDFAFIEGQVHTNQLVSQDFYKDELIFICSPKHPFVSQSSIAITDLKMQSFLMREKNSGTRELADFVLELHNCSITPLWESSSTNAIIQAVSKGIGISVLPARLCENKLKEGEISTFQIAGICFERNYHIIYHKSKFLTPAAHNFIHYANHIFANSATT